MARDARALISATQLMQLDGGAEVFVVRTLLAHPDPASAGYEEEHSLCLLVLVSPDEWARRKMRAELAMYIGAQCLITQHPGETWAESVQHSLTQYSSAFTDVVVALPDYSNQAARQVGHLLNGLRSAGHHVLCTALAVAARPGEWSCLDDAVGFVSAQGMSPSECAIWLHAGLAQLSAPMLIECVSDHELALVWGDSSRPALLTIAHSSSLADLGADKGTHATHGVEAALGQVAVFLLGSVRLSDYRALVRSLRGIGIHSAAIVAPAGLIVSNESAGGLTCVIVRGERLLETESPRLL